MVDVQVRGPGGISGRGTYGFGPFGVDYSYGVSGGTSGVQAQGQITAFGLAVKGSYSAGVVGDKVSLQAGEFG